MPEIKIVAKRIGFSNSTLIVNGRNSILVDTGVRMPLLLFKRFFRSAGISPEDLKLIILTHTHYDHTGNLRKLVRYTGAQVVVHKNEFENLKNGFTPIPVGQGKYSGLISRLGRKIYPSYASPKAFAADMINEDEFDLKKFGINGKIITTPGHTNGSQSVLLGNYLISGDTFLNMKNGRIFPPFANDPRTLLLTWKQLFNMDIDVVFPGHGLPFKINKAHADFMRWGEKLKVQ